MRPALAGAAAVCCAALAFGCAGPQGDPVADPAPAAAPAPPAPGAAGSMTVTLYYGSEDGAWLVADERAVPRADGVLAQGRQIMAAQLASAPEGLTSVFPPGTGLRGFYVTDRAEAFVDLSVEAAVAHPGGSLHEQLTVYAVVNAVTTNLPDIQRVQILVGGREVDTLAGHLDLRRPLEADLTLVRNPRQARN